MRASIRPGTRQEAQRLVSASAAPVAADRDHQRGRPPAQRFVCQPPVTVSQGTPSQPQRRHHWSGSTTRHARTARSGSSRCPVASRASHPAGAKPASGVPSGTPRSSGWVCENFHPRETSTPTRPPTRQPAPPTTSHARYTLNCEEPLKSPPPTHWNPPVVQGSFFTRRRRGSRNSSGRSASYAEATT
jgi:hypothetical protein